MTPENAQKLLDGATPGPLAVCEDRTGWMTITGLSFKIGAALHATDLTYKDRVQRLADADLIAAVHDLARAYIEACGMRVTVQHLRQTTVSPAKPVNEGVDHV